MHAQKSLCRPSLKFQTMAIITLLVSLCLPSIEGSEQANDATFFESKIRPVLVESCFKCHSQERNKSKGGLVLDSRKELVSGGDTGPAIKPGHASDSLLITAIKYGDEDLQMPPDDPLTPEQIKNFETWIDTGAAFPEGIQTDAKDDQSWWNEFKPDSLISIESPPEETIDHYILKKLKNTNLIPAPSTTDSAWIKRITLDLAGRPPTPSERNHFLFNGAKDRKETYIDYLIQSPWFIEQQIDEFNWLLMDGKEGELKSYLETAIHESRSWDQIFKDVILADYTNDSAKGAPGFIKERVRDIDRLTNDVSVRFFGVNISCAQCHDHPNVSDWTQARYYGMKSFFGRTFENGGFVAEKEYGQVSYKNNEGDTLEASLQFLEGAALNEPSIEWTDEKRKAEKALLETLKKEKKPVPLPSYSRRAQLVEAGLAEEQRGYFARAIVNRVWHRLMGSGLVEPLDQMHGDNDPTHPELLFWLSQWFMQNDYDLNGLTRGIVLSRAYQRSSAWEMGERPDENLYAAANIRALSPSQYAATLLLGISSPDDWSDLEPDTAEHREQLTGTLSNLTKTASWFERATDNFHFSVDEALQLSNGEAVQSVLFQSKKRDLVASLAEETDQSICIQKAYQHLYHRLPNNEESVALKSFLSVDHTQLMKQLKSMVWALLTSPESRLNH